MKNYRKTSMLKQNVKTITSHRQFKPILYTVTASLCIGMLFGFIVLQMVGQEDEQKAENIEATTLTTKNHTENNNNNNEVDLDTITAFVHQGGVFSTAENAAEYGKQLEQANIPFITREEDGQHYIWLNIASSEQEAQQLATKMDEQEIDVFIKAWELPAQTVTIDDDATEWLVLFHDLLSTSLQTTSIEEKEWQALIEDDALPEELSEWQATIQQIVFEEDDSDEQILLHSFVFYENVLKELN